MVLVVVVEVVKVVVVVEMMVVVVFCFVLGFSEKEMSLMPIFLDYYL